MLHYVDIKNFKKHVNRKFEFNKGVNLLLGSNYSGKSSVLEAIMFAFGGPQVVEGGASVVSNKDAEGSADVTVEFTADNKNWTLNRKTNSASLKSDTGDSATGITGVNSLLSDLLGKDRKMFSLVTYSKQGESSALLHEGETKLNQMIEQLSGVDLMDRVLANLREYTSNKKALLEGISPVSESEIINSKKELSDFRASEEQHSKQIDSYETETDTMSQHVAVETEAIRQLSATKKLQAGYVTKAAALRTEHDTLSHSATELAEELEDCTGDLEQLPTLENELINLKSLRTDREELSRALKTSEVNLQKLKDSSESYRNRVARLSTELAEAESAQSVLSSPSDLELIDQKLNPLEDELKNLSESLTSGVCSECGRPFDEDYDADKIEDEIEDIKKSIEDLSVIRNKTYKEASEYSKLQLTVQENTIKLQSCNEEISSLSASISIDKVKHKQIVEDLKTLPPLDELAYTDLKERIDHLKELRTLHQSTHKRLEKTKQRMAEISEELDEIPDFIPVDDAELTRMEQDLIVFTSKLDEINKIVQQKTIERADIRASIRITEELLSRLESDFERSKTVVEDLEKSKRLAKFIRDNRGVLMTNLWKSILAQASTVAGLITGGAIQSVGKNSDMGLHYVEEGRSMPIAAASGCQQAVIGVAIRSAISRTFSSSLDFMMLDEITADMDEEHASATMSILQRLNDQIIYITHRSADLRDDYFVTEL